MKKILFVYKYTKYSDYNLTKDYYCNIVTSCDAQKQ